MKIHAVHNEIERGEVQGEGTFSIKATAHSFEILSSGLYSDKPLAIVRELSCNARDSHTAAGTQDIPFEIKLPSYLDPTFHVKDFGTGLSDEQVMTLYTTYFESTKTMSDDFIGQLGLGSKSPFSYTDSFTVESRYNGTTTIYSCYKNEDGLPSIARLGAVEDDVQSGVTVSMSVRKTDFDSFVTASRKAIMYFEHKPNVIGYSGFESYSFKYTSQGTGWAVRQNDNYYAPKGVFVVQGGVAYPVNTEVLFKDYDHFREFSGLNCDLFMPIGSVDVAASREALQYNKRTIANLIDMFTVMSKELVTSVQATLDGLSTEWQRAQFVNDMSDSSNNNYEYAQLFTKSIRKHLVGSDGVNPQSIHVKIGQYANTTVKLYSQAAYGRRNSPVQAHTVTGTLTPNKKYKVLVYMKAKGGKAIAQSLVDINKDTIVVVISPMSRTQVDQKEIDSVVQQLGSPELYDYSHLMSTLVQPTSTYVKRDPEMRLVWLGFAKSRNNNYSRLTWNRTIVDLADGGVYVQTERFDPTTKEGTFRKMLDVIVCHSPMHPTIVGLTDKEVAKVAKMSNWVEVSDYAKKLINDQNLGDKLFKSMGARSAMSTIGEWNVKAFVKSWYIIKGNVTNKQVIECGKVLEDIIQVSNSVSTSAINNIPTFILDVAAGGAQYSDVYMTAWNDLNALAPMLKCISWEKVQDAQLALVTDYINSQSPVVTTP